jgi:hypothetical protein
VQNWNTLMMAFMKEYYSLSKTQSLRNKIATFVQYPTETISEAFERFNEYTRVVPHHKFPKEDPVQKFYQGLTMASKSQIMTHGRHPGACIWFNPRGTSKDSCKWRRRTYMKARSTRS